MFNPSCRMAGQGGGVSTLRRLCGGGILQFFGFRLLLISVMVVLLTGCLNDGEKVTGPATEEGNPVLAGAVVNTLAKPAAGATVQVYRTPVISDSAVFIPNIRPVAETATDDTGRYSFSELPDGIYRIECFDSSSQAYAVSGIFSIFKDSSKTVLVDTLILRQPGTIRGRVVRSGMDFQSNQNLDDGFIHVMLLEINRESMSRPDGSFELQNIPEGTYTLVFHTRYFYTTYTDSIRVESGGETKVKTVILKRISHLGPPKPKNLTARYNAASKTVVLQWSPVDTSDIMGYQVERREDPLSPGIIYTTPDTVFTDSVSLLPAGTTVYYLVRAVNASLMESANEGPVKVEIKEAGSTSRGPSVFQDTTVSIKDALLEGVFVKGIDFDDENNAWIVSACAELFKYDGKNVFKCDLSNSGLQDTHAWDIEVDGLNNVWIATSDGLLKYSEKGISLYNTANSPIPINFISTVESDENNTIWLSSSNANGGGLVKFDGAEWDVYHTGNSLYPGNFIHEIAIGRGNTVWIGGGKGVNHQYIIRINGEGWTVWDNLADIYWIDEFAVDGENNLFLSVDYSLSSSLANQKPVLMKFDGEKWVNAIPESYTADPRGYFSSFHVMQNGDIWAATKAGGGMTIYSGNRRYVNNGAYPTVDCFDIAVSKTNDVFLATGNGVYIFEDG